uniref:Serine and arginine rich splicing factor 6 n=1 Tax=Amphilophus citrinellus TaxID=61819 RepID=A0A3Q0SWI0_AMPCI
MPRVYIGKLSYHVREKDIQRFFSGYGKLLEIDLKNGYGFVEFEDMRDADDAVYELNGKELCGERVVIEHARGPRRDGYGYGGRSGGYSSWNRNSRDKYGPPVRTEHRLIVENLSSRCSWQDLKDFMRQAGEVTYADAHKGRANEGVIEFRSRSDMKRALEKLDGTDINGRKIRLVEDKSRRKRSYSGSRSSSRSRSKGRSHSRSEGKSDSRSKRKSRSKSAEKSRSHTRKSRSPSKNKKSRSRSDTRKSRSKSSSKVKAALKSRSPSQEKSSSKKSRSRSRSLSESRGEKCASKSPPSKGASKSPAKRSASRSRSPSRSRSASQD